MALRLRISLRTLCLILIIVVTVAGPAAADQGAEQLTLLQIHLPEAEPDITLERVIGSAISIRLDQIGTVRPLQQPSSRDIGNEQDARALARTLNADLLLIGRYTLVNELVSLHVQLFEVETDQLLGEADAQREIDLLLNRLADDVTAVLVAQAAIRIDEIVEQRSLASAAPPEEPPAEPDDVVEPSRSDPAPDDEPDPIVATGWKLIFGLGAAVPVDAYAEFFILGPSAELSLHRTFSRLSWGVAIGVARFNPRTDETGEYIRTMVPVFADALVRIADTGPLCWLVRVSAGTAIRVPGDSPVADRLAPVLPAWRTGIATRVALSARMAVMVGASMNGLLQPYQDAGNGSTKLDHILYVSPAISVSRMW